MSSNEMPITAPLLQPTGKEVGKAGGGRGAAAAGGDGMRKVAEIPEAMLYVHKGERSTRLGLSLGNAEGSDTEAAVVAVAAVVSGSLGAESGLVVGDVLLAVNGDTVTTHDDAREKIARAVGTLQLTLRLPRLSGCPKAQEHLMRAGHNANKAMDYYTARRHFTACHELGGRVEALISAVNMTLKLEEFQQALEQYAELLHRPLEPPVMKIIERKHQEAVDKLAAQLLLRAENKERSSLESLPAVAVQAFPVEDDADDVPEDRPQASGSSGLGQLLGIFGTAPTKAATGQLGGLCCAAKRI